MRSTRQIIALKKPFARTFVSEVVAGAFLMSGGKNIFFRTCDKVGKIEKRKRDYASSDTKTRVIAVKDEIIEAMTEGRKTRNTPADFDRASMSTLLFGTVAGLSCGFFGLHLVGQGIKSVVQEAVAEEMKKSPRS